MQERVAPMNFTQFNLIFVFLKRSHCDKYVNKAEFRSYVAATSCADDFNSISHNLLHFKTSWQLQKTSLLHPSHDLRTTLRVLQEANERKSILLNFYVVQCNVIRYWINISLSSVLVFIPQLWMFDLYCNTDRFWHEISRTNELCSQRSGSKVREDYLFVGLNTWWGGKNIAEGWWWGRLSRGWIRSSKKSFCIFFVIYGEVFVVQQKINI